MAGAEGAPCVDLAEVGTQLSNEILRVEERVAGLHKKFKYVYYSESRTDREAAESYLRPGEYVVLKEGIGLAQVDRVWRLHLVESGIESIKTFPLRPHVTLDIEREPRTQSFERWHVLANVSLEKKARIVPLLPRFLESMREQYDQRVVDVTRALDIMRDVEKQIDELELEVN